MVLKCVPINKNRWRNPDFVFPAHKKIIEVFGRYWHPPEHEPLAIEQYKSIGWDCLVVWEDEFVAGIEARLYEFIYPYEYAYEIETGASGYLWL